MNATATRARLAALVDLAALGVLAFALVAWGRAQAPDDRRNANPAGSALSIVSELEPSLWGRVWRASRVRGAPDAPVRMVQFSDFECPACGQLAASLAGRFVSPADSKLAMGFVHFPLPYHRFARIAATVAECEAAQGRFWSSHDSLFANQHSYGLRTWEEILGLDSADGVELRSCLKRGTPDAILSATRELGERVGVKGTPTVIVDGLVLSRVPSPTELDSIINARRQVGR